MASIRLSFYFMEDAFEFRTESSPWLCRKFNGRWGALPEALTECAEVAMAASYYFEDRLTKHILESCHGLTVDLDFGFLFLILHASWLHRAENCKNPKQRGPAHHHVIFECPALSRSQLKSASGS